MDFRIRKSIIIFGAASILIFLVGAFLFSVERPRAEKDVSEWKTYQNEEFGFEFKYPSERKDILPTKNGKKMCTPGMCVEVKEDKKDLSFFGLRKEIGIKKEKLLLWMIAVDNNLGWAYMRNKGESSEKIILSHDGKIFTIYSGHRVDRDILSTFKFVK
jgi:hypothetical protein